jgi:superfamily II RNA helicase
MLMFLKERELLPSINFMFSKKMINSTADRLRHLDFCTNEEKGRIGAFIARCATCPSTATKDLASSCGAQWALS